MGKTDVLQGWKLHLFRPPRFTAFLFHFSELFVKAASINKVFAASPAILFVAYFFGEKWHSINSFLVLLMML